MLESAMKSIVDFRDERDWKQFHTPRNLACAVSVEAAELLELFLWDTPGEGEGGVEPPVPKARIEEEVADVLIFALLFCHEVGIEPEQAIRQKLEHNRERYPADEVRGSAKKYTELN